jgi:hypothetical protein
MGFWMTSRAAVENRNSGLGKARRSEMVENRRISRTQLWSNPDSGVPTHGSEETPP